jgi:twitching motility protein PilT
MVDYVNTALERVVITIEDPIEFIHKSQKSVIKQRELGSDTSSYSEALRRSLRQDPDVIVVGELLDRECVTAALRAAETGHLVITTIHAPDTEQALERIVNMFPPEHADAVSQQLSSCLVGLLFQMLLPCTAPGESRSQVVATELMIANVAIKNLIRERKYGQIRLVMQTGRKQGMYPLRSHVETLTQRGLIAPEVLSETPR